MDHMKKKKWTIILFAVLVLLVIPIPTGVYKDGGTKTYTSLTYKIIDWNHMYGVGAIYDKIKVYPFPMNFMSFDSLLAREEKSFEMISSPKEKYTGTVIVTGRATVAEYSKDYANMSLLMPEGWEYETIDLDDGSDFGINFWPAGHSDGKLKLHYVGSFGVCGTGLSQEIVILGDYKASKGTYVNRKVWDYIVLINTPGDYVIYNEGADVWWDEYGNEAMEILGTITVGEGVISEDRAVEIAKQQSTVEYNQVRADFNFEKGTWTVSFYKDSIMGRDQEVKLDAAGNIIDVIYGK